VVKRERSYFRGGLGNNKETQRLWLDQQIGFYIDTKTAQGTYRQCFLESTPEQSDIHDNKDFVVSSYRMDLWPWNSWEDRYNDPKKVFCYEFVPRIRHFGPDVVYREDLPED
jgi:hypothetical protein